MQIFSFPMRYIDLASKNRFVVTPGNLGEHWTRKELRAIQCVLHATRGLVGTRRKFFEKAFGRDTAECNKILLMPEDYIMHRYRHEDDGSVERWWQQWNDLSTQDREVVQSIVMNNIFRNVPVMALSRAARTVLQHYVERDDNQLDLFWDHEPDLCAAALSH